MAVAQCETDTVTGVAMVIVTVHNSKRAQGSTCEHCD